ncbi:MAG: rod shape-determining protein [Eubacterium sp.]|nr:rod shape-determining protein [Eubacterium sp.]
MDNKNDGYVFGLDIGTRSIVGTVGYRVGVDRFVVVAQEIVEHTSRAVIDGQIHDIGTVSRTIATVRATLEERISQKLNEVSIAAAGRVLKTRVVHIEHDFAEETKVSTDDIRTLEMAGVEKAYNEIQADIDHKDKKFFCVGYSPIRFYLNGYQMDMLEKHPAKSIGMDLIATFLPDEVVEGLYAAVEGAGLHVASMTLEPIAAINVAIPEKFRLLNIALVDVGAGTSDLSIVKDGSIVAYGMIPLAGDEMSEAIAREYLTDFETAERIKRTAAAHKTSTFNNIFGDTVSVSEEEVLKVTDPTVRQITKKIASKLIELNGGKSVSAVFIVGGGGLQHGFSEYLAERLNLDQKRVAIRGADVLTNIDFPDDTYARDSLMVTPIGICLSAYDQSNNFIHVTVNEMPVKLYDNGKVTVLDACLASGFKKENLFPIRGDSLNYRVNGEKREVKGEPGEVVVVRKGRKEVSLNDPVFENDRIMLTPSTKGDKGSIRLSQIAECRSEITVTLFGRNMICPKRVEVSGVPRTLNYDVRDDDDIVVYDFLTVSFLLEFAGLEKVDKVLLNSVEAGLDAEVHDGDVVEEISKTAHRSRSSWASSLDHSKGSSDDEEREKDHKTENDAAKTVNAKVYDERPKKHTTLEEAMAEDPLLKPLKPLPEWMEDVPFDTAKLGRDGRIIPGENDRRQAVPVSGNDRSESADQAILDRIDGIPEAPLPPAEPTHITVNGQNVTIPAKAKGAIFVDVFDVYPFDMSKVGGTRLITRINGIDKNFTDPLKEGDSVEIYWEK